ncbi:MAG TPA: SAM-dependent methyltransferase [Streptosporangiaceae bacterium]
MGEHDLGVRGIDTSIPNVARIYDYLLGGKDNFAADRQAAQQLLAAIPDIAAIVRDNRMFIGRVVRYLTGEAGIRQFLDLGAGLPARSSVHEIAQAIAPKARVVYIDNDPVVCLHGQALLRSGDSVAMVRADLRGPEEVLGHRDVLHVLDLAEPIGVLCASALHFVADEENPYQIIAGYRDRLAPGSFLAITHGTSGETEQDDPDHAADSATYVYQRASAQLHVRSLPEIRRLFDGFDLVEPGVVWMTEWRPDPGVRPTGRSRSLRGGVGRKP